MRIKGVTPKDDHKLEKYDDIASPFGICQYHGKDDYWIIGDIKEFQRWAAKEGINWKWIENKDKGWNDGTY